MTLTIIKERGFFPKPGTYYHSDSNPVNRIESAFKFWMLKNYLYAYTTKVSNKIHFLSVVSMNFLDKDKVE